MGNLEQWISFGMLLSLNQRYNQGQNINKDELHTAIESCKCSHNRDVDNNNTLTSGQKEKRKRLFAKMADAANDYIEQCLRDENKLNE
jgi:hypothetical protein